MDMDTFFSLLDPMLWGLGLVTLAVIIIMIIERRREKTERGER